METRAKRQRISRLMIVEDDESQLQSLTAIMESEGFEVVGCSNASDAFERLATLDVGVAIVDLRLGDMSDTELLDRLSAYSDRVRLIVNTGYSSYDTAKEALNIGAFQVTARAPPLRACQVKDGVNALHGLVQAGLVLQIPHDDFNAQFIRPGQTRQASASARLYDGAHRPAAGHELGDKLPPD